MTQETLEKQFKVVREETTTSHVLQFGELSLTKKKVAEFVGSQESDASTYGPFDPPTDPCLVSGCWSERGSICGGN